MSNLHKYVCLFNYLAGEILRLTEDELLRKHLSWMFSLVKNESVGIEDDQVSSTLILYRSTCSNFGFMSTPTNI